MEFTTINGRYNVEVHGNGWGYLIHCNTTGDQVWVQDDDACIVQRDTNNFENEDWIDYYFEALV